MKEPFFSIVIPTYNHAHFLEKAIQSLIDQEYTNWEAIIIDNYSNDHTTETVAKFNDSRLILHQINNHGIISLSRNKGIELSSGDWIAFLDSDDFWYPSKLKLLVSEIQFGFQYDVYCNDELMVDNRTGKKSILRNGPVVNDFYKCLLIKGNRLSTSATIVKKSFLNERMLRFSESEMYITVEDYDFWLHLAMEGAKFKFINSIQGIYNIHSGNESLVNSLHKINRMRLLHNHIYEIQTFSIDKDNIWKQVKAIQLFSDVISLIASGVYLKAFLLFIKGFFLSPKGLFIYIKSRLIHKIYVNKINQ